MNQIVASGRESLATDHTTGFVTGVEIWNLRVQFSLSPTLPLSPVASRSLRLHQLFSSLVLPSGILRRLQEEPPNQSSAGRVRGPLQPSSADSSLEGVPRSSSPVLFDGSDSPAASGSLLLRLIP
ncbi:uncharacterized protein LOC116263117 [Nymphaea colorata]|uniref:uncharacterized protein LOC116263117 n=1 Tax=Nymphaea colorata TaxID=210225 RepID=UPI00129DC4C0|nr:uncharacterized protein LOC116263117 [Nymphaea colorata]